MRIATDSTLTADADHFYVTCRLDAYEGETRVFARTWDFKIPRDFI